MSHTSLAALLIAVAPAMPSAQADPRALALVVTDVDYQAEKERVEFMLRNDGPMDVIAWHASITAHYPDGSQSRQGMSMDAYPSVAESTAARDRVLHPGDSVRQDAHLSRRRDGTVPEHVDVRVGAIVDAANRAQGDRVAIEYIFARRREDVRRWSDVLEALRGDTPPTAGGGIERLREASVRLSQRKPFMNVVRTNVLLAIGRAQRGEEDPDHAFEVVVRQAEQAVDTARKFSSPTE